jgi:WD domain, G-beta repeat
MKQLVITVHGIRTFGGWQERLEQLLFDPAQYPNQPADHDLTVVNYRFGYFSVLAFLVPFMRWLVVLRFKQFLRASLKKTQWDRIDLVGHSFGTHLIGWALYGLRNDKLTPVHVLLAGSVLKSNFPWQTLMARCVRRVVNDCGIRDDVLLLNQLTVLFTGMAGRIGFTGGTGKTFRNRFFDFGHSGYFTKHGKPDDAFMNRYWVRLLLSDEEPELVDERKSGALGGIWLTLLNNAEPIKLAVYTTPFIALALFIYGLYEQSEIALARMFSERAWSALSSGRPNLAVRYALAGWELAPANEPHLRAPLARALFPDVPATAVHRHTSKVSTIAVSSDGSHAITTADDKVTLWSTRPLSPILAFPHDGAEVIAMAFNRAGSEVFTVDAAGQVRIWDTQSGKLRKLPGASAATKANALFSPDRTRLLVSLSGPTYLNIPGGSAQLYDLDKRQLSWTLSSGPYTTAMAFGPNNNEFATGTKDGSVFFSDGNNSGKLLGKHAGEVTTIGFSADQGTIFSGSKDKRVLLWSTNNPNANPTELGGHASAISAVSLSADGGQAYVIDASGNAYVWDTKTATMRVANPNWSGEVVAAEFDGSGRFAAVGRADGSIVLWDAHAARTIVSLRSKGSAPTSVLTWVGTSLWTGDRSGTITVFDLQRLMRPMASLVEDACSKKDYRNSGFSFLEAAADPLIKEAWDPLGDSRQVCRGPQSLFASLRSWWLRI